MAGTIHELPKLHAPVPSPATLYDVIDAIPAAVYTIDAEGRLTHFNAPAVELAGHVPAIGSYWCVSWKLFSPDGSPLPHDQCPMAIAMREGRAVVGAEIIVERPDGRRAWVEPHPAPLRDAAGRIVGGINVLIDITARKRAEAHLARRAREQGALHRLAERLQRVASADDLCDAAMEAIQTALACQRVSILTFDAAGVMQFIAWRGLSDGYRAAVTGHSPWRAGDQGAQPICVDDVERAGFPDALARTVLDEGIRSLAFIPLADAGGVIGKFMVYYDAPHAFSDDERELALTIGQELTFGLRRLRAEQERSAHERALHDSEERYRSLVEASGAIVYNCDENVNWLTPHPAWEAYTGQAFEQYRGHGWSAAIHPDDRPRVMASVADAVARGVVWHDVGRLWHAPSGSYRYQEARSVPIRDGQGRVKAWVGTCVDIHARHTAEESVREADRRKDEFLAVLAHELRNPLAPIASGLQLLRLPAIAAAREPTLDVMERQVQHLVRLIDDLMEVARITRGTIELRKEILPLQDAVRAAVEINQGILDDHGHRFELDLGDAELTVFGDRVRLTQVVANLLNNAAKYTPRGGRIRVVARREGDAAVVSVVDDGVGVEAALQEHIFEMFARADRPLERLSGGLGIGLSLSRRLAELHGGTVVLHSAGPDRGSTFSLRLPLASAALAEPASADPAAAAAQRRRVLVVDDNRDAALMLSKLLEGHGHHVRAACDGNEALALVREHAPDIVLLDLGMPAPNGFEVARQIRRMPGGDAIRLVAVTGWGQESDRRRSRECGFDTHLVKPLGIDDLRIALGS